MMLEVRDLHAYYGKSHILQGVDLAVDEGEIVSLLGRNGVGRSTTCKAIMGLVRAGRPDAASRAAPIAGLRPDQIAQPASATCRKTARCFPALTVRQNLELGLKRAGVFGRWKFDDVFALFPNLARAPGQSGRRAVGRRAADADDVPHPDGRPGSGHHRRADRGPGAQAGRAGRHACWTKSPGAASSILLVEQKLTIALKISRRLYVMGHGRIVFEGTPAELAANAGVRKEWLEV